MEPQPVRVVYRKFDGSLHWHHPGRYLGEDEYGRWVGCEAGTIGRRGYEPEVVWEFNRYNKEKLVLVDDSLAKIKIVGRWRTMNVRGFASALGRYGVRAQYRGREEIRLVRMQGAELPTQ